MPDRGEAPNPINQNLVTPARGVFCTGLQSSGSTWVYNVAREIFAAEGEAPAAFFCDEFTAEDESKVRDADSLVIKSHQPAASMRALFTLAGLPILLSVRDPRDAAASLMQRFDFGFEPALAAVSGSAAALLPLLHRPNVLLLRFEDRFTEAPGTINAIAARLGRAMAQDARDRLFGSLMPEQVGRTIASLEERGQFAPGVSPGSAWDSETHWHPRHLGDGRIGKWRDVLSPAQSARILQATRAFCRALGYEEGTPLAPGAELDFSAHGTGAAYLEDGFAAAEIWGCWTNQAEAAIRLPLAAPIRGRMRLALRCTLPAGVLRTDLPDCRMSITVNGEEIIVIPAAAANPSELTLFCAFEGRAVAGRMAVVIGFHATGLRSPADCGQVPDTRLLGIGLLRLTLDYETRPRAQKRRRTQPRPADPTIVADADRLTKE